MEFSPTAKGYYDYENKLYIYQYKGHLGNVRISFTKSGTGEIKIMDRNDYYPFGMNFLKSDGGNSYYDPMAIPYNYKYNGKELQETGMYDYGARSYMPDIGRWGVVDPLAETSRRWSTYTYTYNNPIRFIDPDGRQATDIRITGGEADKALKDLQKAAGSDITLSRDAKTGNVTYAQNSTGSLSGNAAEVAKIINDKTVTVELKAENTVNTSTGGKYIGGAFMGNTVLSTGNVEAVQEINPQVLFNFADANGKPGEGILHEVTEGYEGALISKTSGVSSPDSTSSSSVYPQAHNAAHPQPGVITEKFIDGRSGLSVPYKFFSPTDPVKAVYYESNNKTILVRQSNGAHTN